MSTALETKPMTGLIELPYEPGVYDLDIQETGLYEITQAQGRVARVRSYGGPNRAARRAVASKRK